jgi:hypothetical protein
MDKGFVQSVYEKYCIRSDELNIDNNVYIEEVGFLN